jgi:hypothetical protein
VQGKDQAEAERIFASGVLQADKSAHWQALHQLGRIKEATELLRPLDQEGSLFILSSYLAYPFFDVTKYPNLQKVLEREQIIMPANQPIPYACNR